MDIQKLCNNKGAASIYAIFVLMVLLLLGVGLIRMTSADFGTAANYNNGVDAQGAAEAGVQDAVAYLKYLRKNSQTIPDTYICPAKDVSKDDKSYLVTYNYQWSKGTYNGNTAYIVTAFGEAWADTDKKKTSLAKRKIVATIVAVSPVNGHVGDLLSWNGWIHGNGSEITCGNKDTYDSLNSQNGAVSHQYDNLNWGYDNTFKLGDYPYQTVDPNLYNKAPQIGTPLDNKMTLDKSAYYCPDGLTIKQGINATVPTTIYVKGGLNAESGAVIDGNITIVALDNAEIHLNGNKSDITINKDKPDNTLSIYTKGDIIVDPSCGGKLKLWGQTGVTLNGNADISGEIYSEKNVMLNSKFKGTIFAMGTLTLNGSADWMLPDVAADVDGMIKLVKWSKN